MNIFLANALETMAPWEKPGVESFQTGVGIVGQIRGGKSHFAHQLVKQLHGVLPVTIIDQKNTEWRHSPYVDKVIQASKVPLVIPQPPIGRDILDFSRRRFNSLTNLFPLVSGVNIINDAVEQACIQRGCTGIRNETMRSFPGLSDIKKIVDNMRYPYHSPQFKQKQSASIALDLLNRDSKGIYNHVYSNAIDKILSEKETTVIENDFSSQESNIFFLDQVIEYSLEKSKSRPQEHAKSIILLEDAQLYIMKRGDCLSPIGEHFLLIRSTGVAIIMLAQMPSQIDKALLSQVGIFVVCGPLTANDDVIAAGSALGLSPRDYGILRKLSTGQLLVRDNTIKFRRPFLATFQECPFDAHCKDAITRFHCDAIPCDDGRMAAVIEDKLVNSLIHPVTQAPTADIRTGDNRKPETPMTKVEPCAVHDEEAVLVLQTATGYLKRKPFPYPVPEMVIRKDLGLSAYRMDHNARNIERAGLTDIWNIPTGKRSGPYKVIVPTKQGCEYQSVTPVVFHSKHGKKEAIFFVHHIAWAGIKLGFKVEIEKQVLMRSGALKAVDCVWWLEGKPEKMIFFEYQSSIDGAIENLTKNQESPQCALQVIVCPTEGLVEKLKKKLSGSLFYGKVVVLAAFLFCTFREDFNAESLLQKLNIREVP